MKNFEPGTLEARQQVKAVLIAQPVCAAIGGYAMHELYDAHLMPDTAMLDSPLASVAVGVGAGYVLARGVINALQQVRGNC